MLHYTASKSVTDGSNAEKQVYNTDRGMKRENSRVLDITVISKMKKTDKVMEQKCAIRRLKDSGFDWCLC